MVKKKNKEKANEIIRISLVNKSDLFQIKLDKNFKNVNEVITFLLKSRVN